MFGRKKRLARHIEQPIPVLCRFWKEDGVWNATAQHLPVAVFGETFEEATSNLANALVSHFQSVEEAGKLNELISFLEKKAQLRFRVNEIVADNPLVKMLVPLDQGAVLDCV